jgi:FixJ family two-component response regulator
VSALAPIVFLVDDDAAVLRAVTRLLQTNGYEVRAFDSSQAFMDAHDPERPGCLLLDVAMPGVGGLELQQRIAAAGMERAIVFITGQGDIPTSVRAMKAGAVDFLTKPFDRAQLIAAVESAIEQDRSMRRKRAERRSIEERVATLTWRERQVFEHVLGGQLNKQIAAALGTAEKTVKTYRGRVMRKMQAASLADLVRMGERIGVTPARGRSADR